MKRQDSPTKASSSLAREFAQARLNGRLLEHAFECANSAQKLARRFSLDGEKAVTASYLHDIAKPLSHAGQVKLAKKMGMSDDEIYSYPPPVLHGPVGALIAHAELGIEDTEILQAISAHSTGCSGMCAVAKAVFIADYIEITRRFPGAEELRSRGAVTLDELTAAILESKLTYLLAARMTIDPRALALWNELMEKSE